MCKEKHCKSSSWLVNSARWFVMHEHVNIHILLSLLWNYEHTVMCEKCLVQTEESVLLQLVCTGPLSCVWHTLNCIKTFFFSRWCGKVGGGGVMVHVLWGRGFVWGFREGRGIWVQGSHSLGKKLLSSMKSSGLSTHPCGAPVLSSAQGVAADMDWLRSSG